MSWLKGTNRAQEVNWNFLNTDGRRAYSLKKLKEQYYNVDIKRMDFIHFVFKFGVNIINRWVISFDLGWYIHCDSTWKSRKDNLMTEWRTTYLSLAEDLFGISTTSTSDNRIIHGTVQRSIEASLKDQS